MRPSAVIVVVLSASALMTGCVDLGEESASETTPRESAQPDNAEMVGASFAPPEQVGSCVEQIKFGAYTGDAVWTQVWNDVGQTDEAASAYCTQLWAGNAGELAQVHEGWLEVEAFLAAADSSDEAPTVAEDTPAPPIVPFTPPTVSTPPPSNCDPSYPTVCIPPSPPDLNCPDVPFGDFVVLQPDPHGFDRDKDGIGCES